MEPIDEFKGIGKKMPYKAPDDFFERASLKTLQEAKRRERESRKTIYLWRSVAVAASLAAVGFLGYFMLNRDTKPEIQIVVQDSNPEVRPAIEKEVVQPSADTLPVKELIKPEKMETRSVTAEEPNENMDELLADLTDEELLQMAAMVKSDPFEGVQEQ